MKFELMDLNGKKVKDVNLDKEIFGIEPNDFLRLLKMLLF